LTGSGWNAALNAALSTLHVDSCDTFALPGEAVAEQIAALLALAIGGDTDVRPDRTLFEKLMGTLRCRLHEESLSPQSVADQHGMSKRSLYYAFASADTTFFEQLTRLRMERAKEILSDIRFADLPVSEVAARCGFADPSHFARRFKQRFTQPPLHFRQHAAGQ
jgi:AraC-like DNA-binding protein